MGRLVFGGPTTSGAATRVGSSAIRDLLEIAGRAEVISLAGGLPAADSFPVAEIAAATRDVLASEAGALQYGPTEGDAGLRAWIAEDRHASIDQVVVTHGSQQALDLLVRTLVTAGDVVALADPAYVGALQVFRLAVADLVGLPTDRHGLDVDALAERLDRGLRPKLVYVVANFHNPTGATLPEQRRRQLVALAARFGFLIVEDDPYGDLRWRGAPSPSFATIATEIGASDHVVTLGSFSKVLAPGLRVGYVVAPPALASELVVIKQAADLNTSSFAQRIVHRVVMVPGFLDGHVAELRASYRIRADALVDALAGRLGDRLTFAEPDGGMFVWARFDHVRSTDELLAAALDHGVAFVPGSAFFLDRRPGPFARLSFATASPADLDRAAARLASALESVAGP